MHEILMNLQLICVFVFLVFALFCRHIEKTQLQELARCPFLQNSPLFSPNPNLHQLASTRLLTQIIFGWDIEQMNDMY